MARARPLSIADGGDDGELVISRRRSNRPRCKTSRSTARGYGRILRPASPSKRSRTPIPQERLSVGADKGFVCAETLAPIRSQPPSARDHDSNHRRRITVASTCDEFYELAFRERDIGFEPTTFSLGKRKRPFRARYGQCQVVENTIGGVTWTSSPLRRQGGKSGGKDAVGELVRTADCLTVGCDN